MADLGIERHRIVGHSDVDRRGARTDDPGLEFEWTRLRDQGLGMGRSANLQNPATVYDAFFATDLTAVLRQGANGNAVRELQQDLVDIGYVLTNNPAANNGVNGRFRVETRRAVHAFQTHFFSRGEEHPGNLRRGLVDWETAQRIKQVLEAVP